MGITVGDLLNFDTSVVQTSAASWEQLMDAVVANASQLHGDVIVPVVAGWTGNAAVGAAAQLNSTSQAVSAMQSPMGQVVECLEDFAQQIKGLQSDLRDTITAAGNYFQSFNVGWSLDDTDGSVWAGPITGNRGPVEGPLATQFDAEIQAAAAAYQSKIQSILKTAETRDNQTASQLTKLVPTLVVSSNTYTGAAPPGGPGGPTASVQGFRQEPGPPPTAPTPPTAPNPPADGTGTVPKLPAGRTGKHAAPPASSPAPAPAPPHQKTGVASRL